MNTGVTNPVYGSFPVIKFSSFSGILGGGGRTSRRGPTGGVDLVESVSYLRGKHAFKFGFEYLDQIFDGIAYSGAQGAATFTNLQSFLQGIPCEWIDSSGQSHRQHAEPLVSGYMLRMIGGSSPSDVEPRPALRDTTRRRQSATTTLATSIPM